MKTITKFYPHRTALTLSILMAASSLLFVIPMFIVMSFIPATDMNGNPVNAGFPLGFVIAMPFFYLILGYIMTLVGAWLYNLVAKLTGGIKFEVTNLDNV